MIASLEGIVSEKSIDRIILDVAGVGYGVIMNFSDSSELAIGEKAKLYIYEHIRENTYDLFGFTKLEAKNFFDLLLTVNGVGPKMALSILGIGSTDDVAKAISEGEVKIIQSANGVGKRVAERVVVELKDKVGLVATADLEQILKSGLSSQDEAVQALMALGFTAQDALKAIEGIDKNLPLDERVKQALRSKN